MDGGRNRLCPMMGEESAALIKKTGCGPITECAAVAPRQKHLRECYQKAADRFGWSKRNHEPCSMRWKRLPR